MNSRKHLLPLAVLSFGIVAASATAMVLFDNHNWERESDVASRLRATLAENASQEHALSAVAARRAQSPEVRSFAEQWLRKERAGSARRRQSRVTIRGEAEKALIARDDAGVDAAYLSLLQSVHSHRADLYASAASEATDPAIRGMAQQALPKVRADLTRMQQLASARR